MKIFKILILVFSAVLVINFGVDVYQFHKILKGDYKTPYYSSNWFLYPYTNLRISLNKSSYKITEHWSEKDTIINGKEFWTVIEFMDGDID